MIIVTGAAGFIGSNIVHVLNQNGHKDILAVDDLTDGHKFTNLVDATIQDYADKDPFLAGITEGKFDHRKIKGIFHMGACSATTEWNGKFMMENNYEYSKQLLLFAMNNHVPFIYASSAATYGNKTIFKEVPEAEAPINVYGYSKLLFDQYVRRVMPKASNLIAGMRYFNVYGPRESHKGSMASVAFHLNNQIKQGDQLRLFEGTDGYANGEQQRDFIYIDDAVAVNLWFFEQNKKELSGIYNVGTGRAQAFNDVANSVIRFHQRGQIHYIPFPEHLKGHYQSYTQADLSALRKVGYGGDFRSVEQGVRDYLGWLQRS